MEGVPLIYWLLLSAILTISVSAPVGDEDGSEDFGDGVFAMPDTGDFAEAAADYYEGKFNSRNSRQDRASSPFDFNQRMLYSIVAGRHKLAYRPGLR